MTEIDARESAKQEVARQTAHLGGWHPELVGGLCAGFELGAQWAVEQLPSSDEIADAMIAVNPDYEAFRVTETERDVYLRDADAVLALIRERYDRD